MQMFFKTVGLLKIVKGKYRKRISFALETSFYFTHIVDIIAFRKAVETWFETLFGDVYLLISQAENVQAYTFKCRIGQPSEPFD